MGRKTLAAATVLAFILSACGNPTNDDWADPDGVLFHIDSEGGFAPVEWTLRRGPQYTLTVDGQLISEGVTIEIFPGALMPVYQMTQLTAGEMAQIREMINQMGIAGITDQTDDSNAGIVTDMPTDTIVYRDANGTHRYSVYALGLAGPAQSETTQTFAELKSALDSIVTSRESQPYTPERVRVIVGEAVPNAEFTDLRPWPLADTDFGSWTVLDPWWSCQVFESESIGDLFLDATEVTTWESPTPGEGPAELTLIVRGLHPGEEACPAQVPPNA